MGPHQRIPDCMGLSTSLKLPASRRYLQTRCLSHVMQVRAKVLARPAVWLALTLWSKGKSQDCQFAGNSRQDVYRRDHLDTNRRYFFVQTDDSGSLFSYSDTKNSAEMTFYIFSVPHIDGRGSRKEGRRHLCPHSTQAWSCFVGA